MPLVDNGRNAMLSGGLGNAVTHISAHTAIPNTAGNAEVVGGSYARQSAAWAAASAGLRDTSGALSVPIPPGTTVIALGMWNALAAGTYYGFSPVGSTKKGFGTAKATGDVVTSHAHGLANGNRVIVTAINNETIPGGLSATTLYHVVGITADTFQVSLTSGGAAVDITADGELFWQDCVLQDFPTGGTLSVAIGDFDLDASVL
jgi:hypothetical protein